MRAGVVFKSKGAIYERPAVWLERNCGHSEKDRIIHSFQLNKILDAVQTSPIPIFVSMTEDLAAYLFVIQTPCVYFSFFACRY